MIQFLTDLIRNVLYKETIASVSVEKTDEILEKLKVVEVRYQAKELTLPKDVKLSTDFYVEVAPGVLDRILEGPNDIKFPFEEPLRDVIKNLDFSEATMVVVRSMEKGKFEPHFHRVKETIIPVIGSYKGLIESGEVWRIEKGDWVVIPVDREYSFKAGDYQVIPAGYIHRYDIDKVGPDGYMYSIIKLHN